MRRWKFLSLAVIVAVSSLTGCSVPKLTDGELLDQLTPISVDEGSTYDQHSQIFAAPHTHFQVRLPGPPVHDRRYAIPSASALPKVIYETPNISYAVTAAQADWKDTYNASTAEKMVESNIRAVLADVQATDMSNTGTRITLDDGLYIGRHVAGKTLKGRYFAVSAFFDRKEQRILRVIALGSKEQMESPDTADFFTSFKIVK